MPERSTALRHAQELVEASALWQQLEILLHDLRALGGSETRSRAWPGDVVLPPGELDGVNSQRVIEHAVADAAAAGAIAGTESFPQKMTLEIAGLKLNVAFTSEITFQ